MRSHLLALTLFLPGVTPQVGMALRFPKRLLSLLTSELATRDNTVDTSSGLTIVSMKCSFASDSPVGCKMTCILSSSNRNLDIPQSTASHWQPKIYNRKLAYARIWGAKVLCYLELIASTASWAEDSALLAALAASCALESASSADTCTEFTF